MKLDRQVTYIINCSALGDTVCCIPAIKTLLKSNKLYKVICYKNIEQLLLLCDIPKDFIVTLNSDALTPFDPKDSFVIEAYQKDRAPYRMHLTDIFSVFPLNAILRPEEKSVSANAHKMPVNQHIDKEYVVIGCGYALESRKLQSHVFNDIVKYCRTCNLEVILLGSQRATLDQPIHFDEYDKSECVDLINKTSIAESISIMNNAKCVIGVDSGLIYLASLTETPIICGYTFVDPIYRMPYRHGQLGWNCYPVEPHSECRYCSNLIAAFDVTFDVECPKNKQFECSQQLKSEDFIRCIDEVLINSIVKIG